MRTTNVNNTRGEPTDQEVAVALALNRYKFPLFYWEMIRHQAPRKDYVILFTARSGSSWLCEFLRKQTGLGRPDEWLNNGHIFKGLESIPASTLYQYLQLRRRREQDNVTGLFGIKASWLQIDRFGVDRFFSIFRPEKSLFFLLFRDDKVAQAVSLYRAVQTGFWHSNFDGSNEEVPYVFDDIARFLDMTIRHERCLLEACSRRNITPINLSYESITGSSPRTLLELFCGALGVAAPKMVSKPDLEKIATRNNDELIDRFTKEKASLAADSDRSTKTNI